MPTGPRRWVDWISPPPSAGRHLLGIALAFVGGVLALGFCMLVSMLEQIIGKDRLGSWGKPIAQYFAVLVCSLVLLTVFRFARRLRARHALAALKKDRRPPLLLLRAFRDDFYRLPGYEAQLPIISIGKVTRTFEEYLHEKLSACGPVIAIGRPGEKVPPLGAPRFWVPDDKWKAVIRDLLAEAQYVLMILGNLAALRRRVPAVPPDPRPAGPPPEDGLTWEVRQVFALPDLRKLILLMPPVNELEAQSRWEQYRVLSGHRLPAYQGGELAAVFDAQGQAWVMRAPPVKGFFRQTGPVRDQAAYNAVLEVRT
jgi:hypothetical protein